MQRCERALARDTLNSSGKALNTVFVDNASEDQLAATAVIVGQMIVSVGCSNTAVVWPNKNHNVFVLSASVHKLRHFGRPVLLESFAGTCGVTPEFGRRGFDSWGIDYIKNKLAPQDPHVLNLDVVADHDQTILLKLFYHPLWLLVYLATPRRTASKEKEVRLGISGLQPLWREAHS